MEQQSAAGLVFLLALVNAWLARRRDRSALRWFFGSFLLAPFVWVLTLYLLTRPRPPRPAAEPSPLWGWAKLVGLVTATLLLAVAVLFNLPGQSHGGATASPPPQPLQTP